MGTIFDVSTLGTAANTISFNSTAGPIYYRLTDRYSINRQIRQADAPLPEQMGTADWQTLIGASNYILKGTMYPQDETTYDTGRNALRNVGSLEIENDDAASDFGYVPYKYNDSDGYAKQINLKVLYTDLRENSRSGLKLPFILYCKVKFPVIQGQTAISANIGDSTATTSGSSNLPFTLPHAMGLTTYSSNGSINNVGTLPSYPVITLTGPLTTPRITNSTSGEYIELTGLNLPTSSDTAIISYDQDTVSLTQAGNSVYDLLTSGSTLFKLRTGTNNLTLSGATVGSGALASISTFPLWPLS